MFLDIKDNLSKKINDEKDKGAKEDMQKIIDWVDGKISLSIKDISDIFAGNLYDYVGDEKGQFINAILNTEDRIAVALPLYLFDNGYISI